MGRGGSSGGGAKRPAPPARALPARSPASGRGSPAPRPGRRGQSGPGPGRRRGRTPLGGAASAAGGCLRGRTALRADAAALPRVSRRRVPGSPGALTWRGRPVRVRVRGRGRGAGRSPGPAGRPRLSQRPGGGGAGEPGPAADGAVSGVAAAQAF